MAKRIFSGVAVIMAGGRGTRVRHLYPDLPKPLIPVLGKPWLHWLLRYFSGQGITKFLLSSGYLGDQIEHFTASLNDEELSICSVTENVPLGTGGGFLHAIANYPLALNYLVANGDSIVLAKLAPFFSAITRTDTEAEILGVQVPDAHRYGTLEVGNDGNLKSFSQNRPGAGLINAGVYLFKKTLLARFPKKRPLSFEYDVFPQLLADGVKVKVMSVDAPFIDIGTESSLAKATAFVRDNMRWFE